MATDHGLSHDRRYFDSMYGADADPWGFDSRFYERRKYALTLAALPRERYVRAVEPGCSNGAFTELLAPRCDELIAFDFVEDAVERRLATVDRFTPRHAGMCRIPHVVAGGNGRPGRVVRGGLLPDRARL